MIRVSEKVKLHGNYFIALEDDLEALSRFIEFCPANLTFFSIELAHLLFAAASEVDVLAKCLCRIVSPSAKRENINDYRSVLNTPTNVPVLFDSFSSVQISVPRYGLTFVPWENWAKGKNPDWWGSYNQVKHRRDQHFHEATLQNALNALGALLILNVYYYRCERSPKLRPEKKRFSAEGMIPPREVTRLLKPDSRLLRLPAKYYYIPYPPPI